MKRFGVVLMMSLIAGSAWAQQQVQKVNKYEEFSQLINVEDQEKYYNNMIKLNPPDAAKPDQYGEFRAQLMVDWLAKGNMDKYRIYKDSKPKVSVIHFLELCNVLESWSDQNKNTEWMKQVSAEFLNELDKGSMKDEMNRAPQILLEVNALANCRLGNIDVAKKNIEKAQKIGVQIREMKYFSNSKANFLARYGEILSAAGESNLALDSLSKAVREAESNPRLVQALKGAYLKVHGSDQGSEQYVASLQKEAYQKIYKEVEKDWIANAKKVPDMSVPNLKGELVKLSDYRGKILVIDFWTTLCKPCVAAFSAFQRIAEEYKNEPFQLYVADLFEDRKTVETFVAKKDIKLDVLHDEPNKLGEALGLKGTPHKFIIDPAGYVRMEGLGYAGSDEREYYKTKAMIEITKERFELTKVKGK